MPTLTRRELVALAALGPATALAASGSAPPPELEAFLERGTYVGDLEVMLEKGVVRVLTAYSETDFFVDRGATGGVTYEYMREFEAFLRKRPGAKRARKPAVHFVPLSREEAGVSVSDVGRRAIVKVAGAAAEDACAASPANAAVSR